MRKFFVTLMTSLLSCSAAFAFWPEASDSSFNLGVGYRRDRLQWKTEAALTSDSLATGVESKIKWHNLNIWQIEGLFKYVTCDNIYFRAYADYGWVTSGRVTDKFFTATGADTSSSSSYGSGVDFSSNDEVFSVKRHSKRGHVYDVSLGLGYQFKMCDDSLALTPVVGYAWNGQHFGFGRTGGSNGSGSGSDSYLSSASYFSDYSYSGEGRNRYNTRWNGPWLGFDVDYRLTCDWSVFAAYEFHWATYHAKVRLDRRSDVFGNFHHRSKRAYGQVAVAGIKWDFCECWTAAVTGQWSYYHARHGKDKALIADTSAGDLSTACYLYTPLKNVNWQSASVSLDVGMMFQF